eukprot:762993-Hanusia_phi.AAC.2
MLAAPLGILDLHRLPTLVVGDLGRSQRQLALLTAGAHCVLAVIVLRSPPRAETGDGREGSAATGCRRRGFGRVEGRGKGYREEGRRSTKNKVRGVWKSRGKRQEGRGKMDREDEAAGFCRELEDEEARTGWSKRGGSEFAILPPYLSNQGLVA